MKKLFLVLIFLLFSISPLWADVEVYSVKNKFGLKDGDNIITPAKYSKLIRLNEASYLFCYRKKYGIISNTGEVLVENKYTQAQRFIGRYAKLGSGGKYAVFDEYGDMIIDKDYSSIDLLYGRMFLVGKNYMYGLISFDGDILLAPVAQDIYMPERNIIKIKYDGIWYEIEQKEGEADFSTLLKEVENDNFRFLQIIDNPVTSAGYGVVSAGDYFIKLFSSISPAYEKTIDELIFDHGADTVSILAQSAWLFKFPVTYTKNYFNIVKAPNNGPLSDVKNNLRHKITK